MSLMKRYALAQGAGLLPTIAGVALLVLLLSGASGIWLGIRWQQGQHARAENKALQQDIQRWIDVAVDQRQAAIDLTAAARAAGLRMDAIATQRENDREQQRKHFDRQRTALEALLRQRPDLPDLDLGDDVLCHWNTSKAGGDSDSFSATAIPGCQPAPAVPRAADGHQRPR